MALHVCRSTTHLTSAQQPDTDGQQQQCPVSMSTKKAMQTEKQCKAFEQLDKMMEDILENEMPMCAFAFAPPPLAKAPTSSQSDGHICRHTKPSKRSSSRKKQTAAVLPTSHSYTGGTAAAAAARGLETCSCGAPIVAPHYDSHSHRTHPHHACTIL